MTADRLTARLADAKWTDLVPGPGLFVRAGASQHALDGVVPFVAGVLVGRQGALEVNGNSIVHGADHVSGSSTVAR